MNRRSAIVITIDGLGARGLGAYGSADGTTPHLDNWAAKSVLLEQAYSSSPEARDRFWDWLRRAPATDWGPCPEGGSAAASDSWIAELASADIETCLVTDDPVVAEAAREHFSRIELIPVSAAEAPVEEWADTAMGVFLAAASQYIQELAEGELLWIHARGFLHPWDAPLWMRQNLCGEDDPPPPEVLLSLDGPAEDVDPDLRAGWQQAWGAQLQVLDQCLGVLFEMIETHYREGSEILTIATSPRGFPLAEHGVVGVSTPLLHDELLHVPALMRWSTLQHPSRCQEYFDHTFFHRPLECWLRGEDDSADGFLQVLPAQFQALLLARFGELRALRTWAWKLIVAGDQRQLFVKPDDRWEHNEVAARCRPVAESMESLLIELDGKHPAGRIVLDQPLAAELTSRQL